MISVLRYALLIFLVVVSAACSRSTVADEASAIDESGQPTSTGGSSTDTQPPTTATQRAAATSTTTSTAAGVIQGEPVIPGFPLITVFTPSAGGGTRPLLRWESVPDASLYSVVVYDTAGEPYWGTLTDEAQTYVGGPHQIVEDRPGPRVADGGAWSVVALDAGGRPLAGSGIAPISP